MKKIIIVTILTLLAAGCTQKTGSTEYGCKTDADCRATCYGTGCQNKLYLYKNNINDACAEGREPGHSCKCINDFCTLSD